MPIAAQVNSTTGNPTEPTYTGFTVNSVQLKFWINKDVERGLIQLMVKKATDTRPWMESEHYVVFTITSAGELYRNKGLPTDWGFRLTKDRRIKEVV
jgi:hypothetical protein